MTSHLVTSWIADDANGDGKGEYYLCDHNWIEFGERQHETF
jgi:hypothetical protein